MTYEESIRRWVATWHAVSDSDRVTIGAEKGWGGCDTCGYGDGSGIFVYVNGEQVREYAFSDLDTILRGLLESD